jgi:uncharacterized peroxidase-related enzyme
MTFIETVPEAGAPAPVAQLYETDRDAQGRVPNYTRAFSLHTELYAAWRGRGGAIKQTMDLRRYELATLAAARRLRSSYCALAHGSVLASQFLTQEQLLDVVADHRHAGLDEVDVAVMDLAEKVAGDATLVGQEDVDRLRSLGLGDRDILDVVAAAAMRCFFSKMLDALGAEPDPRFEELDPPLRRALTVGRPFAE